MNTKQLAIMAAVAAALGGTAWYLNKNKAPGASTGGGMGAKVLEVPVDQVASLQIQSASGKVSLTMKDGRWVVDDRAGYPANFERIRDMLINFWEMKTVQEVKVGASQYGRLELAEPLAGAGTKVEFKNKDGKLLGTLLLGKRHMKEGGGGPMAQFGGGDGGIPVGRYVTVAGSNRVSLVNETLDEVEAKPEDWLARDFFKVDAPSAITVAGATEAQKWKLTRADASAEWTLEGAKPDEKVDPNKVMQLSGTFSHPTFADVLAADAKPEETGLDKPSTITLQTFDGFTYVVKVGKAQGENYPVKLEVSAELKKERTPGKDEKPEDKTKLDEEFKAKQKQLEEKLESEKKFAARPYLIAKSTVEQVLKDRSALLPDKPAENAPPQAGPPGGLPPGAGLPPGHPPVPPRPPISVTTPPVTVEPAKPPPADKPATATTPPVSIESAPKAPAKPANPGDKATPPKPSTPDAKPAPANTPAAPPSAPAKPQG